MAARADDTARTRERIARAAAELFRDAWFEDVSLAAIARAAGVSHQTVLNHFESKEGVARGAWELVGTETQERRRKAHVGDVASVVGVLIGEYERIGDSNTRWAATADRLGSLASLLEQARAGHQEWLIEKLGPRIPAAPEARRRCVNALHVATDVYTWKLLRRDLGLGRAEVQQTMVELAEGVLASG